MLDSGLILTIGDGVGMVSWVMVVVVVVVRVVVRSAGRGHYVCST